ncbi:hypothetical protein L1887_35980 [Cichorium endivia]|nr:hypothetical protein L1887_35980 [Cichorium endivia]
MTITEWAAGGLQGINMERDTDMSGMFDSRLLDSIAKDNKARILSLAAACIQLIILSTQNPGNWFPSCSQCVLQVKVPPSMYSSTMTKSRPLVDPHTGLYCHAPAVVVIVGQPCNSYCMAILFYHSINGGSISVFTSSNSNQRNRVIARMATIADAVRLAEVVFSNTLSSEVFEVPNDLDGKDPKHLYLKEELQPVQTNGGEEENLRDEEAEDEEVENEAAVVSEVQEEENDALEEDLHTQGQKDTWKPGFKHTASMMSRVQSTKAKQGKSIDLESKYGMEETEICKVDPYLMDILQSIHAILYGPVLCINAPSSPFPPLPPSSPPTISKKGHNPSMLPSLDGAGPLLGGKTQQVRILAFSSVFIDFWYCKADNFESFAGVGLFIYWIETWFYSVSSWLIEN